MNDLKLGAAGSSCLGAGADASVEEGRGGAGDGEGTGSGGEFKGVNIYGSDYVRDFLKNKHIVVIGDSVQRGVYKDLVSLLQSDGMLLLKEMKNKCEREFRNDRLIYATERSNGIEFTEAREFQSEDGRHLVQYYFVTRCYYEVIEGILSQFKEVDTPDIVLMNSCLWDISRYGEESEEEYRENLCKLFTRITQILPPTSMFIWLTTLPVASHIGSGFLLQEMNFLEETLRVSIIQANYDAAQAVLAYGLDVLDLNFYLRPMITNHRLKDGVHWDPYAHRHITDLILTYLHDSWGVPLPDQVVNLMNLTNGELDLKHFLYQGAPSFTKKQLDHLAALTDQLFDSGSSEYEPDYN